MGFCIPFPYKSSSLYRILLVLKSSPPPLSGSSFSYSSFPLVIAVYCFQNLMLCLNNKHSFHGGGHQLILFCNTLLTGTTICVIKSSRMKNEVSRGKCTMKNMYICIHKNGHFLRNVKICLYRDFKF